MSEGLTTPVCAIWPRLYLSLSVLEEWPFRALKHLVHLTNVPIQHKTDVFFPDW